MIQRNTDSSAGESLHHLIPCLRSVRIRGVQFSLAESARAAVMGHYSKLRSFRQAAPHTDVSGHDSSPVWGQSMSAYESTQALLRTTMKTILVICFRGRGNLGWDWHIFRLKKDLPENSCVQYSLRFVGMTRHVTWVCRV